MKNLATRRSEAWTEHGRNLYCPHSPDYKPCSTEYCAHYNPDTDECIHVEAAQAQVAIAKALLPVAAAKESEQTGDMQQATKWLEQGKRVTRPTWCGGRISSNGGLIDYIQPNGLSGGWWNPRLSDLLATDWVVRKE